MVNTTFLTSGRQFKTDPLATTVPEREREWHTHNVYVLLAWGYSTYNIS